MAGQVCRPSRLHATCVVQVPVASTSSDTHEMAKERHFPGGSLGWALGHCMAGPAALIREIASGGFGALEEFGEAVVFRSETVMHLLHIFRRLASCPAELANI